MSAEIFYWDQGSPVFQMVKQGENKYDIIIFPDYKDHVEELIVPKKLQKAGYTAKFVIKNPYRRDKIVDLSEKCIDSKTGKIRGDQYFIFAYGDGGVPILISSIPYDDDYIPKLTL